MIKDNYIKIVFKNLFLRLGVFALGPTNICFQRGHYVKVSSMIVSRKPEAPCFY